MILPPFYPILDTALIEQRGIGTVAAAEALIEAGVRILQLRHKGFFSRAAFEEAGRIAEMCRRAEVLFVVNDRADVAKLLDAALHLGQDDLTPSDAQKIVPAENILGFSTHNEQQLQAADAEPVDYLAFGPIFATGSKLNPDPVVGLDRLRTLRELTRKPLVAIGGITRDLAPEVFKAGADSVAIIGDLCTGVSLRARAEEWIAISDDARARAARPR